MYQRHPIEEIEGIGKALLPKFHSAGIYATEDLLSYSEAELTRILEKIKKFPIKKLRLFLGHARIMQVGGLTGQYAEALYKAGRQTLLKVASPNPQTLVDEINAAKAKKLIKESIDLDQAIAWQKRALTIYYTPSITGTVTCGGKPVAGAELYIGQESALTDDRGKFWIPVADEGGGELLIIRAKGYKTGMSSVSLSNNRLAILSLSLEAGEDVPVMVDENKGGYVSRFLPGDTLDFTDIELKNATEGSYWQFRTRYKNGKVKLISVARRKVGSILQVDRMKVDGNLVDSKAKPEDIYQVTGGTLKKSSKTLEFLRRIPA